MYYDRRNLSVLEYTRMEACHSNQDTLALFRMLDLLENPVYLDDDCILRLYETAAYYRARLYIPDDSIDILHEMKKYLLKHPSAYYL